VRPDASTATRHRTNRTPDLRNPRLFSCVGKSSDDNADIAASACRAEGVRTTPGDDGTTRDDRRAMTLRAVCPGRRPGGEKPGGGVCSAARLGWLFLKEVIQ